MKKKNRKLLCVLLCLLLTILSPVASALEIPQPESQAQLANAGLADGLSDVHQIVIFIDFPDSSDLFTDTYYQNVQTALNGSGKSLRTYYQTMSYGALNITSHFYPANAAGEYITYMADHPLSYYIKKQNGFPANGYQDITEGNARQLALVEAALTSVSQQILDEFGTQAAQKLDSNGDGEIDSAVMLFNTKNQAGYAIQWSDAMWSRVTNVTSNITIAGKRLTKYMCINAQRDATFYNGGYFGTIAHEFGHILGLRDLYSTVDKHYESVGSWDLMSSQTDPPQFLLQYQARSVLGWGQEIPEIQQSGTYTLHCPTYTDEDTAGGRQTAYIIKSPISDTEFFVVEFRKRNSYDLGVPTEGLLIYKINLAYASQGNKQTQINNEIQFNDYIYIVRSGYDHSISALRNAPYCSNLLGRGSIGTPEDTDKLRLENGLDSMIQIKNIGSNTGESISFEVVLPELPAPSHGSGSASDPYLIADAADLALIPYHADAYYQLIQDIHFPENTIIAPLCDEFKGTLDGNGHTISGLHIEDYGKQVGMFRKLGANAVVKNLTLESPQVTGWSSATGIVAGEAKQAVLENIRINNGIAAAVDDEEVTSRKDVGGLVGSAESATLTDCAVNAQVSGDWAGGLAGNISLMTVVDGCRTSGSIQGKQTAGGLGGACSNRTFSNSFSQCAVSSTAEGCQLGGLFGMRIAIPGIYQNAQNLYWDVNASGQNTATQVTLVPGLEATGLEGLTGILLSPALSLSSSTPQQLTLTTIPAGVSITGQWATLPFYSNVTVSASGLVTPLYQGESPVTFTMDVGGNPMTLTCMATVSNAPEPPKTLITRINSSYAMLNGVVGRTTCNQGYYTSVKLVNGRTMAPVRFISEALAMSVTWTGETGTVTIVEPKTGDYVTIALNSTAMTKYSADGTVLAVVTLPTAPMMIDGSVYIPVRSIGECFGYQVEFREHTDGQSYVIVSTRTPVWTAAEIIALCDSASGLI